MISPVVQTLSVNELAFIAALDYGTGVERHFAALRSVCFDQAGIITEDQQWYPYEVIELGAHWLQDGHEREFAICTLLVLANVAAGVDRSTNVQAKLSDRAADYDRLPADLREEILNAYQAAEG